MRALKKSAVLYHYPCPDGAFAALAAHLYFKAASLPVSFFPNTVYDPIRPEDLPLNELGDVYLLDFAGPPSFIKEISPRVERFVLCFFGRRKSMELNDNHGCVDFKVPSVKNGWFSTRKD